MSKVNSEVKLNKKLTKNAKVGIIIALAVVILALAIGLPLGLLYGKSATVPTPAFVEFNQNSDYTLRVTWSKINGADGYYYQYCYGDPNDAKAQISTENFTRNLTTSFERCQGTVAFRVKANVKDGAEYSNWIKINVDAWVLTAPVVTVGEDLSIGWTKTTFKYYDKSYDVPAYAYNLAIDEEWLQPLDLDSVGNTIDMRSYIINLLTNPPSTHSALVDKIYTYNTSGVWQDVVLKVRVKALNKKQNLLQPSVATDVALKSLKNIYHDSEYGYAELVITENLYNQLTRV